LSDAARRDCLRSERFDAAIRIGILPDSSLVARRVATIRSVLVASPRYLAERGRPQAPGDLTGHECLIYTGTRLPQQWRFRSGKRWISVRVSGRLHADNGDVLLAAAVAGMGIAHLPSFVAAPAIETGEVVPLLEEFPTVEAGLHLVRPPGPHVPGSVRALTDLLVERFGGAPFWDACEMARRKRAGSTLS
jgi:DNA-binding transcriptional LysR family regulator